MSILKDSAKGNITKIREKDSLIRLLGVRLCEMWICVPKQGYLSLMISQVDSMCGGDIQSTWMAESRSYWSLVIYGSCLTTENDQDFRCLKLLGNYSSSCKEKEPAESWIWVLPLHWSGRGWGQVSFRFPWKRRLDFNSQAAQSETPESLRNSSQCITFRHIFTAAVGRESTTTWGKWNANRHWGWIVFLRVDSVSVKQFQPAHRWFNYWKGSADHTLRNLRVCVCYMWV